MALNDEILELELYALVGRDEHGSGQIGIKQGIAATGYTALVAIQRDKLVQFLPDLETIAATYGNKISMVRFKAVEIVHQTLNGSDQ